MALAFKKENTSGAYTVDCLPVFDFLGEEYAALFAQANATAFQTPHWLHAFYNTLCPALDVEPFVMTVRDSLNDDLLMVLPMVRKTVSFVKIIQPADLGITDYNQPIVSPETFEELADDPVVKSELLRALNPFDLLLFRKVRSDGLDVGRLFDNSVKVPGDSSAHDLPMPMSFEDWKLEALSKSTRKNMGRKERSLVKEIGEITFRTLVDENEIEEAFVMLRDERGKKYPGDFLSQKPYYDFYLQFAKDNAASGEAVTFIGDIKGKTRTVEFGLCNNGRHLLILGAYDPCPILGKYSLGMQSMYELMRSRKEIGINMFDYTTGDESYKSSLKTTPVPMHHYVVSNGVVGRLGLMAYQDKSGMRKAVQRLMPKLK